MSEQTQTYQLPATPQCEKWAANAKKIHTILDFLAWAQDEKTPSMSLCTRWDSGDYIPDLTLSKTQSLIAEFMGIDEKELERERRMLIEHARSTRKK